MGRSQLKFTRRARGRGDRGRGQVVRGRGRGAARPLPTNAFRFETADRAGEGVRGKADVDDLREYVQGSDVKASLVPDDPSEDISDLPPLSLDLESLAHGLAFLPAHTRLDIEPEYCDGLRFRQELAVVPTSSGHAAEAEKPPSNQGPIAPSDVSAPELGGGPPKQPDAAALGQAGAPSLEELLGLETGGPPRPPQTSASVGGGHASAVVSCPAHHGDQDLDGLCDELLGLGTTSTPIKAALPQRGPPPSSGKKTNIDSWENGDY